MRRMKRLLVLVICSFVPVLLATPVPQPTRNVIVGMDMDFDDIIALALLSNQLSIDIKLVTINTVAWVNCKQGQENVAKEFQLLNKTVPKTACGRATTLNGGHSAAVPEAWRQQADNFFGIKSLVSYKPPYLMAHPNELFKKMPSDLVTAQPGTDNAVAQIVEVLKNSDLPVDIIALSTLTNLSDLTDALSGQPELIDKINGIYMMGGAFSPAAGNLQPTVKDNAVAEWNMYIDPQAAQNVLSNPLGLPLIQFPLNITNQVLITSDFYTKLKAVESPSNEVKLAIQLFELNPWLFTEKHFYFWDSLTAIVALNPEAALYWENQNVMVETANNNYAGQTTRQDDGINKIAYSLNPQQLSNFDDWLINLLQADGRFRLFKVRTSKTHGKVS